MNDEQINEVMRLADEIADYAWRQGLSDGAYSQAGHDRKSCDASRAALETYLRTIARAESAMPFWPNHPSAISDPLFHQARGIMGTENFGQEEALRLAILHVLNARAESAIETPAKVSPCAGHAVQQDADEAGGA